VKRTAKKKQKKMPNEFFAIVTVVDRFYKDAYPEMAHVLTVFAEDGGEYKIPGLGLRFNPLYKIKVTISPA